jgi:hypothetical protein
MAKVHKGRVPARRHPGHRDTAPAHLPFCLPITKITQRSPKAGNGGTQSAGLMSKRQDGKADGCAALLDPTI